MQKDTIIELLNAREYIAVKNAAIEMNEVDLAELFEEIYEDCDDAAERESIMLKLFRLLTKDAAAEVFAYLDSSVQQVIIEALTDTELKHIIDDLYLDDCVDMIEEMPASVVKRVLKNAGAENRRLINQYLKYPDDSAGSIMTNEYISLKCGKTVAQAFDTIRSVGADMETIYTCYVTDALRHLIGTVSVRDMLLSDMGTVIDDIMDENVIFAKTMDDKEEVAKLFSKYDMLSLPVVDNETRMVGIVTIDDAVDVIQEENTEDFEKMAGMAPSEESYLKTSVFKLAKNRIIWLLVLMVSAMAIGAMLEGFEAAIAGLPLLVSFIPMLMGTGGNCGSQASTMIIRGLALDEIKTSDFIRVWFKEVRVALLCGVVLCAVNFARIYIQYADIGVATVVSLTLMITVCVSKSLGCVLPILAKKLKLDPAIMASPMITTLTDACSMLVFFNLAMGFLGERL